MTPDPTPTPEPTPTPTTGSSPDDGPPSDDASDGTATDDVASGATTVGDPEHLLTVADAAGRLDELLARAATLKRVHRAGGTYRHLPDRTLAALFEQPSTRTRVSVEAGMARLGGQALVLTPDQLQLGRGEPIADTARVLSGYVDGVLARVADHATLTELAEHATVPVINGLSDRAHPLQTLADLLTVYEAFDGFEGVTAAWVGDGNNVAASFAAGCALAGVELTVATPEGYELPVEAVEAAADLGAAPTATTEPRAAVAGADVVYTDVWVSMSDEADGEDRASTLAVFEAGGFQVDADLLAAGDDPVLLHCLPAHRGEEVTAAVLDGERSLAWAQAENRLHATNALLVDLLGGVQ